MREGKAKMKTAIITLGKDVHDRVRMLKAELSAKKGKALTWDEFFELQLSREQKKRDLISWLYTLGIFVAITFILMFPLYVGAPLAAMGMLPMFILIGLIFAFFSAYVLTPYTLRREVKPFDNTQPELLKSLKELSEKAMLKKYPKLMIAETPEINAMAYVSLSGTRVCVTRGLINAVQNGKLYKEELNAILGHEIGHIKNYDCFKFSFVLSWISIFDVIGTIWITIGMAISGIGITLAMVSREEEKSPGIAMALVGWMLVISGFIQKIIAKIASILAFHLSRKCEYAADMVGAELTSPEKMASALQKINTLNNELVAKELATLPYADRWQLQPCNPSWIDKLFDTHPPTEKRVNALRTISEFL